MTCLYRCLLACILFTSATAAAAPVRWTLGSGGNGHLYEVVNTASTVSWTTAKAAAEAMIFNGQPGYLITVTSAAEQAFLESLPKNSGARWAGGRDVAAEGVWRWETGPEAGTQFWQGGAGGFATGPFNYANWLSGEPNNSGNEDYLSWNQSSVVAGWNDVGLTNSAIKGYIVEFVPEPSTSLLLGAGLVGLAARRWRSR